MQPKRQVVGDPLGYRVDGEQFVTTDRELATSVATALDRVDPLPCTGHGDWVDITSLDQRPYQMMCGHCGHNEWFSSRPSAQ